MDLGLSGRKAIVCASSQGLGLACAAALAREGCAVVINGRHEDRLATAMDSIGVFAHGRVQAVAADIESAEGRRSLLAACPEPDILVTNNRGPSPGVFADFDEDAWLAAINSNMLSALMLIRSVLPGMRARRFGRIVNITSAMVKSPRPGMELSTAARAGLTAACKAISISAAADNVTINNLLPERIDTDRQRFMTERMMKADGVDRDEARRRIANQLPAKRFGTPAEFGDACAFLCSAQAGFITGQNLQLDGGGYHGLI
ncbi:MAG TPA: SDR family oxidoreductase [Rhodoblastus sp.]|nr:SDR family oxidoreductase [Rhodoblastus sp.]